MTFDEIPLKMMQLGISRAWLAEQCDYSISTIANILAAGGNPAAKTEKALRRISEALEREEDRQKKPSTTDEKCSIVIRPTVDQYAEWNEASLRCALTVEKWAIQQLNMAAEKSAYVANTQQETQAKGA